MKKPITLIAYLLIIFCVDSASAQDEIATARVKYTKKDTKVFDITTLDGRWAKVKIIPDYIHAILKIESLRDSINISDFWKMSPEIHLLNKNFIEIKYEVRGGSNLGLGNTLIICVKGGRLYEAMHVLRYSKGTYDDYKTDYHIKTSLNGNNKNNYKLIVSIHDYVYSKSNPEQNYNHDDQTILSFDIRRNVFYSVKENQWNKFAISNTNNTVKQKVGGNFPVIILGKESYYFVNNRWYQQKNSSELNEILN